MPSLLPFKLVLAPPSSSLPTLPPPVAQPTTTRRTTSGLWVLQTRPLSPSSSTSSLNWIDEKHPLPLPPPFPSHPCSPPDFSPLGYPTMPFRLTTTSPTYALSDPTRGKSHASPAELEAGARELGLPNPLPLYCHEADEPNEPDTIAKKLFIFGFMFPLLWLVGACILCVPLKAYDLPPSSVHPRSPSSSRSPTPSPAPSSPTSSAPVYSKHPSSSDLPRPANLDTVWTQPLVDLYARAERHWAWRCVWAFCALVLLGVTVVCALLGTGLI